MVQTSAETRGEEWTAQRCAPVAGKCKRKKYDVVNLGSSVFIVTLHFGQLVWPKARALQHLEQIIPLNPHKRLFNF